MILRLILTLDYCEENLDIDDFVAGKYSHDDDNSGKASDSGDADYNGSYDQSHASLNRYSLLST